MLQREISKHKTNRHLAFHCRGCWRRFYNTSTADIAPWSWAHVSRKGITSVVATTYSLCSFLHRNLKFATRCWKFKGIHFNIYEKYLERSFFRWFHFLSLFFKCMKGQDKMHLLDTQDQTACKYTTYIWEEAHFLHFSAFHRWWLIFCIKKIRHSKYKQLFLL